MDQSRRDRLIRFSYLLNALLFFLGGFGWLEDDRLLFAIIQFVASSLNLIGFLFALKARLAFRFKQSVLVIDILVAMGIALNYVQQGKQYIQYAWVLAAIMSLVALIILSRRQSSNKRELPEEM